MVITPDGETLIAAETWGGCLTAFDREPDGSLLDRRVWAQLDRIPLPDGTVPRDEYYRDIRRGSQQGGVTPDGICLDAEGAIWVASPTAAEVLRVREGGEVLERIQVEGQPFACMLGGAERRTLHILIARTPHRSGRIETVEVDLPGAGLP
jgi:sugar lactone lactonase YvrE